MNQKIDLESGGGNILLIDKMIEKLEKNQL
jgi:hypothetical protein